MCWLPCAMSVACLLSTVTYFGNGNNHVRDDLSTIFQLDTMCCGCGSVSSSASAGGASPCQCQPSQKSVCGFLLSQKRSVSPSTPPIAPVLLRFRWNDFIVVVLADEHFPPVLMPYMRACPCPDFSCHRWVSEMASLWWKISWIIKLCGTLENDFSDTLQSFKRTDSLH